MITDIKIKEIIDDCKSKGFEVKVRDIAYILLCEELPEDIAFKCIFYSSEQTFEEYSESPIVVFLKSYWKFNMADRKKVETFDAGITYDENKSEMEKLIRDLTKSINADEYADEKSKITAQKTVADLRIKLSEKFNISSISKEQVVQVEQKYNSVCDFCHHEIAIPTKEELMKKYNLIERMN